MSRSSGSGARFRLPLQLAPQMSHFNVVFLCDLFASSRLPQSLQKTSEAIAVILSARNGTSHT